MKIANVKRKAKALKRLAELFQDDNVVIVVEGKHDKEALQKVGLASGNVIAVSPRRLDEIGSMVEGKKVVILTDFDSAGLKLMQRVNDHLESADIDVDAESRKRFKWIFPIQRVEDLPAAYAEFVSQIS